MAEEDDLDAFFEDVQQAEVTAVKEDGDANVGGEPPTKKKKIERPRGVVVAAASVVKPVAKQPVVPPGPSEPKPPSTSATSNRRGTVPPPPPPPPPPPLPKQPQVQTVYIGPAIPPPPSSSSADQKPSSKKGVVLRTAAGKTWVDNTLADWPDNDFRLFVGNLDPAVTDQQLYEHFDQYASLNQVRIIRDNKTGASKGYGFVSLQDPLECAKAMRETDQSWLGSRPVKVKRASKDRDVTERRKKEKKKKKR